MLVTASDVFTGGLLLYEVLAGKHPYRGRSSQDYAARVMAAKVPAPVLGDIVPAEVETTALAATMVSCLSLDPTRRPPAYDVLAVLDGQPPVSSGTTGALG
jgi:serine/threonine protein kinase